MKKIEIIADDEKKRVEVTAQGFADYGQVGAVLITSYQNSIGQYLKTHDPKCHDCDFYQFHKRMLAQVIMIKEQMFWKNELEKS